jgi:transposase-like protein
MVFVPVRCPYCHTDQVVKRGKTETGKQRYRCQNPEYLIFYYLN